MLVYVGLSMSSYRNMLEIAFFGFVWQKNSQKVTQLQRVLPSSSPHLCNVGSLFMPYLCISLMYTAA